MIIDDQRFIWETSVGSGTESPVKRKASVALSAPACIKMVAPPHSSHDGRQLFWERVQAEITSVLRLDTALGSVTRAGSVECQLLV